MNNTAFYHRLDKLAQMYATLIMDNDSFCLKPSLSSPFSVSVVFEHGDFATFVNENDTIRIESTSFSRRIQRELLETLNRDLTSQDYLDGIGVEHTADAYAECEKIEFPYDKACKPRVFFDMDGTLAKFHTDKSMEEVFSEGYFRSLEPIKEMVEFANVLALRDDVEVCILSKSNYSRNQDAIQEKIDWLHEYCPNIKDKNFYFVPLTADKRNFIPYPTERDVLIDDYMPNFFTRENDVVYTDMPLWDGKKILCLNDLTKEKDKYKEYATMCDGAIVFDETNKEDIINAILEEKEEEEEMDR